MRELIGAGATFAGLVVVLLIAIRGFRPLGSSSGGSSSGSSGGILAGYGEHGRTAIALSAVPAGWAIGKVAAPSVTAASAGIVLGALIGAALCVRGTRNIVTALVGGVGLTVSLVDLMRLDLLAPRDRVIVLVITVATCVVGFLGRLLFSELAVWGLLAAFTGLKLAVFALQLQSDGTTPPTTRTVVLVTLVCVPGLVALSALAPMVVLPLIGIGLVTAQAMVAVGVLDGRDGAESAVVLAAAAAAGMARWIGSFVLPER